MIGKVIEGRYEGAIINKFPDRNVLFVQTEDGSRIALSKSNAISIDDVSEQYPSYGRKVMMVIWNDFETSIFLIGVPKEEQKHTVRNKPAEPPKSKKKTSKRKTWIILLLVAVVLIAVCGYFVSTQFLNRHEHTWANATCNVPKTCEGCGETEGVPTPHSWIEATCQKPKTCLECGETEGVPTDHSWIEATSQNPKKCANCGEVDKEASSDIPHNTEDNRPKYTWNVPTILNLPLADIKVGMYKNSSEYWIEFSCDTMDTEEFLTFLIHSTSDWGFDRTALSERLSIVFRMYDSAWDEGNIAYSSMEGYGIKWTAYGDMKDDNRCVVGLKVNKLNEFEAVCNADIVEATIKQQNNTIAKIQTYSVEEILLMNGNFPENEFYVEGYVFSHNVVQMGDGTQRGFCTLYPSLSSLPSLMESDTLANDVGDYIKIGHNVSEIDNVLTQMMDIRTGDWVKFKCINIMGFEFELISIE